MSGHRLAVQSRARSTPGLMLSAGPGAARRARRSGPLDGWDRRRRVGTRPRSRRIAGPEHARPEHAGPGGPGRASRNLDSERRPPPPGGGCTPPAAAATAKAPAGPRDWDPAAQGPPLNRPAGGGRSMIGAADRDRTGPNSRGGPRRGTARPGLAVPGPLPLCSQVSKYPGH